MIYDGQCFLQVSTCAIKENVCIQIYSKFLLARAMTVQLVLALTSNMIAGDNTDPNLVLLRPVGGSNYGSSTVRGDTLI